MEVEQSGGDWEAELAALLTELSSVQEELLEVLDQKRDRMVKGDVQSIEETQSREDGLTVRLQTCHDWRKRLLDQAAQRGLPSKSIAQLASAMPTASRDKLGKQVKEASSRMRLLQHNSLTNWVVAQRTLLHLSQMLEIIATGGRLKPTYGKGESAHSRGSLVDRAA